MKAMQIKHGMAVIYLLKSTLRMSCIIITPTRIRAGAVACAGIERKRGARKRARRKQTAVQKAVSPLRPPTFTPEALSRSQSNRQFGIDSHHDSGNDSRDDSGCKHRSRVHTGIPEDTRIDGKDVSHGKESGDSAHHFLADAHL